ncbi:3743_t:CDS:2 [Entrophospora sp. SA101]|nr:3743_t:CDS:2 [Entrophospora sp. SA101]
MNIYTETDIIVKSVEYIINGLTPDFDFSQKWGESFSPPSKSENYTRGQRCDVCILSTKGKDLAEWEFSQHITPVKIITDRCRSNRVNQAILNSLFKIEQLEDHVDIKVQYVQMAGINDYYVVSPGQSFVLPTSLHEIRRLKNVSKIFNHLLNVYQKFDHVLQEVDHSNVFQKIFKLNSNHNSKRNLHDPLGWSIYYVYGC